MNDIIQYVRKNAKSDLIEFFKSLDHTYGGMEITNENIEEVERVEMIDDL